MRFTFRRTPASLLLILYPMPLYRYKARNEYGAPMTGTIDSHGKEAVAAHLGNLGFIPVSIEEERQNVFSGFSFSNFQFIKPEDLIVFSRQLATLINAGLPFLASLDTLVEQTQNRRLRGILVQVRKDVEGGLFFSDALARHPKVFSPLFINMIRAGEIGGVLDDILERLARLAEHEAETRARIKVATRYPKIVLLALVVAFSILVTFVIPKFSTMYANFKVELPLPTRILISINDVVQNYWFFILAGTALTFLAVRHFIRTETGRLWWDSVKLKLPIFGPIYLKVALSRFSRIFGTLTRSGLPVLQTLETVSTTVGNVFISRVIHTLRESARQGKGLVHPMRVSGVFPPVVVQMVAVGEETGKMEEMMLKVSEYYDMEVEYTIKNLSTILEPLLLVLIGGMVLFLAVAIFLPWWNLVSVLRSGVGS